MWFIYYYRPFTIVSILLLSSVVYLLCNPIYSINHFVCLLITYFVYSVNYHVCLLITTRTNQSGEYNINHSGSLWAINPCLVWFNYYIHVFMFYRPFTIASTLLPVTSGALGCWCMRYGVWDTLPSNNSLRKMWVKLERNIEVVQPWRAWCHVKAPKVERG